MPILPFYLFIYPGYLNIHSAEKRHSILQLDDDNKSDNQSNYPFPGIFPKT